MWGRRRGRGLGLPPWLERRLAELFPNGRRGRFLIKSWGRGSPKQSKPAGPLRIQGGIDPTERHPSGHSIPVVSQVAAVPGRRPHRRSESSAISTARIGDSSGKAPPGVQSGRPTPWTPTPPPTWPAGQGPARRGHALVDFQTPAGWRYAANSEWLRPAWNLGQGDRACWAPPRLGQMLAKEESPTAYSSGPRRSACNEFLLPAAAGLRLGGACAPDLELGGLPDQKFNVAMARSASAISGQRPQFGALLPILPGLDGVQKMSKSRGNTVGPLWTTRVSMYSKAGENCRLRWWMSTLPCSPG